MHTLVCVDVLKCPIQDTINKLECIHVSFCTDNLTGFNYSLSVNSVLHVLVCVDVCVCVCVFVCVRARMCVCARMCVWM